MSTVGDRIRLAREARGLGVNELARRAALSQGQISKYENAKGGLQRGISNKTLAKLATALQVRPEWLLTGEGDRDLLEVEALPHRTQAVKMAREGGVSEAILEAVMTLQVPDAESKTTWWWVQAIQRREVYLREEGALPPSSQSPMTLVSPAVSSHLRPAVKRSR